MVLRKRIDSDSKSRTRQLCVSEYFLVHNWKPFSQICPEMQVNEVHALYDKHHKVSSFLKSLKNTKNSVNYEVLVI